jgi:hypothetical protein
MSESDSNQEPCLAYRTDGVELLQMIIRPSVHFQSPLEWYQQVSEAEILAEHLKRRKVLSNKYLGMFVLHSPLIRAVTSRR